MSSDEVYASPLKVHRKSSENWMSTAATVQATRPGTCPRNPLVLELRKHLRTRRETIDEMPKMECAVHLPTLAQEIRSAWTKQSARDLAGAQESAQACFLEFAATQEDFAVSAVPTSIAL